MTIKSTPSKTRRSMHVGRERLSCYACSVRGASEWCEVDDDGTHILNQAKVCHIYEPGQVVFRQGHACAGVFVVESGTVALRRGDSQGNRVLVRLVHGGETFGTRAFFAGSPYESTAEALSTARICFVDQQATHALLQRHPALAMKFLKSMARQLQDAEDARLQGVALPVRARLAHLLLRLHERFSEVSDAGVMTIRLPVSRQDLAEMVGTRPETIARTIRSFADDGVAFFEGRTVLVPDVDVLLNEVEDVSLP